MSHNHQNRVSEHFTDEAMEYAERGYEKVQEAIREEPLAATLAAFGIGLALGTAAAMLLSSSRNEPVHTARGLESLGRRVLDSIREALPDAVSQHLPRV